MLEDLFTAKNKIVFLCSTFVVVALFMFFYGYGILDKKNRNIAETVATNEQNFQDLLYEQVGFEQGKRDLKEVEESNYPPNKLFPKNTSLVDNIRVLENLAKRYNLGFVIQLSSTGQDDLRTPGIVSPVFSTPYTLTLTGQFRDVMAYSQTIENLQFPTHIKSVQISVVDDGSVSVILKNEFFIEQ